MLVITPGAVSSTKELDIPTVVDKAVDVAADVVYLNPKPSTLNPQTPKP